MVFFRWLERYIGTYSQREIAKGYQFLKQIEQCGSLLENETDKNLRIRANMLRERAANNTPLSDLMVDTYALVREISARLLNMRHFDVQILGGIAMHRGNIAEMKTGEGKTLVATLPAVLNALSGKGVHVVTVNDYLAQRDAQWMLPIYEFLGLSVGVVTEDMDDGEDTSARKQAYAADITYATNHELVFDYLRDNLATDINEQVQRPFNFALIDEVDLLLLDEAETPLIISGSASKGSGLMESTKKSGVS